MGVGTGNRPGVLTAALVAAGVLASAAGCGTGTASSDNDGDTIKLGVITAEGSSLTNYPDVTAGASAAIDAINEAGGINGKQIEYFYCNTRGEVNQAMACAREADTEGVDAIVGRVDIFSTQTMPILEAAGIPDIGNVSTGAEIDYQSPYTYPLHAGNYGAYSAMPYAFKEDGAEKMVVATVDLPIGIRQGEVAEEVAESLGLDVAPMIKVPTEGVTDYAPYAQQIKDSGADAAIVALGPAPFQAFMKAADSIGLSARIAGTAFTFGQSEAAPIGDIANGMFVTAPYPSTDDRDVPGIAEYHAQLDAAGAEDSEAIRRLAGLNAWLSVHAAAEVIGTIEGEVTRETVHAALQEATGIDLFGLVTFNPGELATDLADDAFARFPKADYHVLTFDSPTMIDAGQEPISDPLHPVR